VHTKQAAYRSYAVAALVHAPQFPRALYWDTGEPYHYARLAVCDDGGFLVAGGEDHKTGQDDDGASRVDRLASWAHDHFPGAGKILYAWSGQIIESVDALAFIGRNPGDSPNIHVATGFSGNGMTYGVIAGMLISDLILGRTNPWEEIYKPSRVSLLAAPVFLRETGNVAAQYAGWVTPGEVSSIEEIPCESGAVMRDGLRKLAVFRDRDGAIRRFSAVCPHFGCIVAWNSTERTWDCPCHGSRFSRYGQVLNGPAVKDLESITP